MKRLFLMLLLLASCLISSAVFANSAPTVTNVTASQRTDGSGMVDIYYTLADAENNLCTITVLVSSDGGSTWTITPSSGALAGDVGANISPGNRLVTWASKMDLPGVFGTNYRTKITADDYPGPDITWVMINDPGFVGQISRYETTNAQYVQFLNAALASDDIDISDSIIYGANGSNTGADFVAEVYYDLAGLGFTYDGAINGGSARINYSRGSFSVDGGFENHPVTHVSWYGAMAFCNYYGWRLPTEWEWQAVANYDGSYNYGCGVSINNNMANYYGSSHPHGTTFVGELGIYGYGIADMAGNVWEWTNSYYYLDYSYDYRVLRGGSWLYYDNFCTVWERDPSSPYFTDFDYGFRVCR